MAAALRAWLSSPEPGLPVISHAGNDSPNVPIGRFLELAARFPGIRFIAAHLGIGVLDLGDTAINAWRNRSLLTLATPVSGVEATIHGALADRFGFPASFAFGLANAALAFLFILRTPRPQTKKQ